MTISHHRPRRLRPHLRPLTVAAAVVLASLVGATLPGSSAQAAGVTTHAWMSLDAVSQVTTPKLKALLEANRNYVRSGAIFPDSGYALSNTYGEEAHWQRFHDAYLEQIKSRSDCGDLTAPNGPCAPQIAFLMGMVGHGIGDEVWDWLFEPNGPDLDEYYSPDSLAGYANDGGAELQMDIVAIADHKRPTDSVAPWPSKSDILATYHHLGYPEVNDAQLSLGQAAMSVVMSAESQWAPQHISAVRQEMAWMAHNMVTAPGGVKFASRAIAAAFEAMWGRMLGTQPPTVVSNVYPAEGQRRLPTTGWDRSMQPGSAQGRGGARTRIAGVLSYSRPYVGSAGTVASELPVGSMILEERDTNEVVAGRTGWPRSVPYGPDSGERMIGLQPSSDLKACTWYRVSVTSSLVDARNQSVTPRSWEFRTGADAEGNRCSDDPYTADENFLRLATLDLLERQATTSELNSFAYKAERGQITRASWLTTMVNSEMARSHLVSEAFLNYLSRLPDSGGLSYWTEKLKTIKLPNFQAQILGSSEVYNNAGGTNSAYVSALYPLVLDRSVDSGGLTYWASRLDKGMSRTSLAMSLLTSREVAADTVTEAYHKFLDRQPDSGGLTYWTNYLMKGKDQRDLWRSLMALSEYDRKAQGT
ncbi:MAG: DUF4214 domain-containing protein [Acidimicrobiales bacterium]|nr:DUF4214 domain-containing protein [Acidimicrobiales bacterium]